MQSLHILSPASTRPDFGTLMSDPIVAGRSTSLAAILIKVAAAIASAGLVGCAAGSYPTNTDVQSAVTEVPELNTIAEGRAYLAVVRANFVDERDNLQKIDYGIDTGIVGGLVTTALGAALHWGAHSTTRAGIFTAATIGVGSALSLKTQEQIINKGLDSLVCVESQAEAAYVSVSPYDALLAPVARDIRELNETTIQFESEDTSGTLSDVLAQAKDAVAGARLWFATEALPIANVNAGVKIGVNSVLQTTIDQLNSALPDTSAFAKISMSYPSPTTPPSVTPPPPKVNPSTNVSGETKQIFSKSGAKSPPLPPTGALAELVRLDVRLATDMAEAKASLDKVGPVGAATQLPAINCPVPAVAQPLQISAVSSAMLPGSATSTATATISGGTPPYKAEITAATQSLTPQAINATVNGLTVTLTGSAALVAGQYNLVVTDSSGTQKTTLVTVAAAH